MNSGDIIARIVALIDFFQSRCHETDVLDDLRKTALDRERWPNAHALFGQIRAKTLKAQETGDITLVTQRLFEEIVAKTLYNLSYSSAPFDADSAFFVIPNAIAFAKTLGPIAVSQMGALLGILDSRPHD